MAKKQTLKQSATLEGTLALAGIILIVLGCIANIYNVHLNLRFIHDPIFDTIYYFRYIVLLAGGFGVGYLLTKKSPSNTKYTPFFNGVFYAAFAMLIHELLFAIRFMAHDTTGDLPFPWEKVLYLSVPLVAFLLTLLTASIAHRSGNSILNLITKRLVIAAFVLDQLYLFTSSLTTYDVSAPVLPLIINYLLAPITVAGLTYLLLPRLQHSTERALYAVLIATFYSVLGSVLWLFRSDPTPEATDRFTIVTALITITLTSLLMWRVQRATQLQPHRQTK